MTRKITPILVLMLLAGLALAAAMPVLGQSEEQERSRFLSYVEEQLSGPGRTIRMEGIEGALSSSATIAAITIADDEGVWLRIEDAAIEWTRSALLRGRLDIESLRAARIDWPRMAVPPEGLPAPEAGSFEVPEIPLAIEIGALEIEQANLGEPLFGLAAQLSGTGALSLEDGSLDARFDVTRLDGPGGELSLQAAYANASTQLDLDISLTEPADGVIANVLNLEGQPPVSLALQGGGPLDALDVELTLDTDAGRILSGQLLTQEQPGGRAFATALEGPIFALIAPTYRGFFGARSSVMADGFLADEGSIILNDLTVESGALSLVASAATAPDGFPTRLALDARFAGDAGRSVLLPVPGESTRAAGGRLLVNYGDEDHQNGAWTAQLRLQDVESGTLSVARTALDLSGTTRNLADPQTRAITFDGLGEVTGFEGNEAGVAQALGNGLQVQTQGSWQAGAPVLIDQLAVLGDALSAALAGQIEEGVFAGDIDLDVRSLAPFAALADRPLGGALALDATGTIDLLSAGFDLALNGLAQSVQLGSAPVDALLAGDVTMRGGLARTQAGLEADSLRIDGRHIAGTVDGLWASQGTDLSLDAQLTDLAVLTDRASGAANLSARATGNEGPITLAAQLGVPQGRLVDQTLRDAALDFDGMLDGDLLAGALTLDGLLGSAPITASMHVRADSEVRALSDIAFATRGAALAGELRQQAESGLLDGALRLEAQDIRTLALLALVDASGAVNADVQLSNTASTQNIAATGTANSLAIEDLRVGSARFDVDVADAFGVPRITGTLNGQGLQAGDITITRVDASSAQSGSFSVTADGINAPALRSAGLGPARLRADGAYGADTINLSSATLTTGGVEATASGRIPLSGGSMDVSVRGNAPLSLAEPFLADRGTQLSGLAALNARITGALSDPSVSGTLDVSGGQVVDPGSNLRLTGITASARLTGDAAVIEQASAQVSGGGTVNLSGRVGLDGDLPADLRIGLRQVRYADGTLVVTTADGDLTLTGPLARGALLGGTVRLLETNIQIPDSFGDAGGFIELDHIAPSERIRTTFERALGPSDGGGGRAEPALRLDVQVTAPSQIYVRGRGVNAELGGAVRLTGSLNSITPVGAFNLIRGRIDILGQRIALSEGSITLVGDLDPFLNIVAQTDGDAIVVVIAVRGRVSDPTVTLSSQPELPQDEVLARLIFNRSLNELSPLQIAQLALAAAELAGQSNGSALGSLRDGLGLSDLDVVTDDAGNPAVRAGQYVQENVYVGVEASTDGSARTTINLDITEDITARGAVGSDGESSLGIFFERDY